MIFEADQSKLQELLRISADMTAIAAGYYSQAFTTISSLQFGAAVQKEEPSTFLFLSNQSQGTESFLHDPENDYYYFSVWVPVLQGFIVAGPYQTLEAFPEEELVRFETCQQDPGIPAPSVSKHQDVRIVMNSMIRHYFYYDPETLWGNTRETNQPEEEFMNYFKNTDPESVEIIKGLEEEPHITLRSGEPVSHLKNKLVVTSTLFTRILIASGAAISEALDLLKKYVATIEQTDAVYDLNALYGTIPEVFYDRIQEENRYSPFIQKIFDFIQSHLHTPLDVKAVADYMNLSQGHVSTVFKKECGVTLKKYILERKVKEAKRLILYSDRQLSEVAAILRFNDQTYFTKVFKRITGQTPLQYRKQRPPLF